MNKKQLEAMELKPSRIYEVTMRYQAANYQYLDRVMRARWMGVDNDTSIPMFSLRPLAGTQAVPVEWITSIRKCSPKETVCLPYKPTKLLDGVAR